MSLSSLYLDAFVGVAKFGSFSLAAKKLGITQSALSQRVKNLEEDLGLTLFLRNPNGVELTEQGQRLLRYCQTRNTLEEELLTDLSANNEEYFAGTIRIAAYSSILRSVIIPSLASFLKNNPKILCKFICAQVGELPSMLYRAEVDFIITDYKLDKSNLETVLLGTEQFVVIESKKKHSRDDIFLDNDTNDRATEIFFQKQKGKAPKYRRSYFDDCYGIIEGVEQGLGRAVMSGHLVKKNSAIKIINGFKPFNLDVCLHFHQQPFYSKLHKFVVNELNQNASRYL